ncbi:mitochondrial fission process protein 1 [Pitangus sulphuratus]|nr:mitochondrial fission process protein 1 [Pitangus sulphuratus]
MHTNAHSMDNKQEELEATVQQESYDVVAITETWWNDTHDWSAALDGYKCFRRDRRGRRVGGVAQYVRQSLGSLELEVSDDKVECLWVRIRGKANKADILVGVSYRPRNHDEEADELFYKLLADVSRSPSLALMVDFSLTDVCCELNTAEKRQSRRFLECMEDSFLSQLVLSSGKLQNPEIPQAFEGRGGCLGFECIQIDKRFEQVAMLYEEFTWQHTICESEQIDTWYYALIQAEQYNYLKSLEVECKLASQPELTGLVDSQNKGNWILSLFRAERRVSPLLCVSLHNRYDALGLEGGLIKTKNMAVV